MLRLKKLSHPKGESCLISLQPLGHILVPTVGTEYSKNAGEVEITIAAQPGALVTIINMVNFPHLKYILYEQRTRNPVKGTARDLL